MSRVVRVAVADSGINPNHRHIRNVSGGVGVRVVDGDVRVDDDWHDQLGHGTAVAATILGHAPNVELWSIRIFRRRLEARVEALRYAIDWSRENEIAVLNLSLGCDDAALAEPCRRALDAGVTIVTAASSTLATMQGVIAVQADAELEHDELRYENEAWYASPWARPLENLPRERNFKGVSLAVAHVSGHFAKTGTGTVS